MSFFYPVWLIMTLPLLIPLILWKAPSRTVLALRILLLALIILAMAGLAIKFPSKAGTAVLVIDRSRSMPKASEANISEILNIVQKSCPAGSRLGIVSFAENSGIEKIPENNNFSNLKLDYRGDQSNMALAMRDAMSLIPDKSPGRILILSDGAWTGIDPSVEFARCASRGIPVDFRTFGGNRANDLAIKELYAPHWAPKGEFYLVNAEIKSPSARYVEYTVFRNGKRGMKGSVKLNAGLNFFSFRDCSMSPGTIHYSLELACDANDPCPGNNRADFLVRIQGSRPALLLAPSRDSGLGKALITAGHNVEVKETREMEFSLGSLSGYSSVVLENVPASEIGNTGMETIAGLVKKNGTGLMITGGRNSFGLGGYYKSPLEEVLPVSMELRNEHRKLSMAMVLVLDRSGSMSMQAGNGRVKMDLANIASVEVLNILGPLDSIGVIAVDSEPHTVVELMPAPHAASMKEKILHIQSMGGGIFVYNGLAAAGRMLAKAQAGTKHIILFADAADAEQPHMYRELLEKFKAAGISVSVVGLGSERDTDADFLIDVAKRGGGRCFFTSDVNELPRLFAQDTFVVARNTFIDEAVKVKTLPAMRSVCNRKIDSSFELGGYNLCYLRPQASAGAVTEDEYKAPVAAFWQAGIGRVLCFTGEADGKYSGKFADWPYAGKLLSDFLTWTSADEQPLPEGMMISQEIENGAHKIRLHLDPERKSDPFRSRPIISTLSGMPGRPPQAKDSAMDWETPDIMLASIPLSSGESSLSTVKIDNLPPHTLAPVMLPYSPEYKPADEEGAGGPSMKKICALSGGRERLDLAGIWKEMPVVPRLMPLSQWLLVVALIVLLMEVLERRTAFFSKRFHFALKNEKNSDAKIRPASFVSEKKRKKREKKSPEPVPAVKKETQTEKAPEESERHQVLSAFDKVRKASKK